MLRLPFFNESQSGADILKDDTQKKSIPRSTRKKGIDRTFNDTMNLFKSISGGRCKRKSKYAKTEVKQELGIKEEVTNDGDYVIDIPRQRVDDTYRADYEGPVDFADDFDEVKDEIKCEEEETGKEKDTTPCERSNESAANYDDNEEHMGDAVDIQPPQPNMNPFKSVSRGRCKRKSKSAKVEIKQEPGFKEEPNDGDAVMNIPRPRVGGRYRVNYDGPFDFDYDFDEVKDEIKCEGEETGTEKDSAPRERSNDSAAANNDDNEEHMDDAVDIQPPQPVSSGTKRNRSSKRRNKRTIPRNQAAKKQKKHKCHVCNYLANRKFDLKVHLRIHTGKKPFQCDVCSKSFARKGDLNTHKETHGPKPQFRCSKCYQRFEHESDQINHEKLCDPLRFECDICGYRTINKSHLTVHMQTHSGVKPFECSICFKSFTTNARLQSHSMTHIDELPNACSKCGRRFATPEHKQSHETRCQRSVLACNQCQYKAVRKDSLKRHMQSKHGAKRSIECEICGKPFVEQIKLNQHLSSTHRDQFPFQCSKCFGGYASEDGKIAHEDSCGYRQYQCHLCKDHRRDKASLMYHMRKDHTGERIQCKVCAASFTSKSNADQHMKAVHRLKKI
ncbi:zinc finger protein 155-like [Sitodiplosis mosellana]|uniref:zinc finger protein 155-like n=1 Tax=Sitodiplosis mosellana TaxID=263140 RepID=UPI002444EC27|nr:zinc finger protein 155-like [Sitodiplosis mosellana]